MFGGFLLERVNGRGYYAIAGGGGIKIFLGLFTDF